jgi:hypothetical protein
MHFVIGSHYNIINIKSYLQFPYLLYKEHFVFHVLKIFQQISKIVITMYEN